MPVLGILTKAIRPGRAVRPRRWSVISVAAAAGLTATLAGCAHMPPRPAQGCRLIGYPIIVGAGDRRSLLAGSGRTPSLEQALPGLLKPIYTLAGLPAEEKVLVLSGGSQHGAFGAGFFRGRKTVPDYRVIAAVSTGAIQSTFIFLAHQPVPQGPLPAYFHDDPLIGKPRSSYLTDLALAYAIGREGDLLAVNRLNYVGAAVDGSLATFAPLRHVLGDLITAATLVQVADQNNAAPKRALLVGVTNLDDGVGYAIDLTKLVADAVRPTMTPSEKLAAAKPLVPCYIDAIVASATVPPGVPPVSLTVNGETHMFMDGGARFGVFFQQIERQLDLLPKVDMDLVVNGKLFGDLWLENGRPVTKWSIVTFGLRAVALLENQVYRFSVDDVERWAAGRGSVRFAFIANDGLTSKPGSVPPMDYASRLDGRTCGNALEADAKDKPQEFDHAYMRCLIDYGQARGELDQWNPPSAINHP